MLIYLRFVVRLTNAELHCFIKSTFNMHQGYYSRTNNLYGEQRFEKKYSVKILVKIKLSLFTDKGIHFGKRNISFRQEVIKSSRYKT